MVYCDLKTFEGLPSEPVGLQTVEQTDTTLTLSWRPPSSPNGIIREYKLRYFPPTSCAQNNGDQSEMACVISLPASHTPQHRIVGLGKYAVYDVSVAAVT